MCLLLPLQFSGFDEMKKPEISKFNTFNNPERVNFVKNCLKAAERELDLLLRSFPPEAVEEAREIYRLYFGGGI